MIVDISQVESDIDCHDKLELEIEFQQYFLVHLMKVMGSISCIIEHNKEPQRLLNVCCHLSKRVCVHVRGGFSFRSYVLALRPLERLCLLMAMM